MIFKANGKATHVLFLHWHCRFFSGLPAKYLKNWLILKDSFTKFCTLWGHTCSVRGTLWGYWIWPKRRYDIHSSHASHTHQNDLFSTVLFFTNLSHPIIEWFWFRNSMMSGQLNWETWNRIRGQRHLMAGCVSFDYHFILYKTVKRGLRQSVGVICLFVCFTGNQLLQNHRLSFRS